MRNLIDLNERADLTKSAEFRAWFGNSKIVDRHGKPLVVYHGTSARFDRLEVRSVQDTGIYFTPDPEYASGYAQSFGDVKEGSRVLPCVLSIKNPVFFLTKPTDVSLKIGTRGAFTQACIDYYVAKGYDGIVNGVTDYEIEMKHRGIEDANEICAFHADQVKSIFEFKE